MMFLLIVTLTSMLLAAIMSVIAWRIAGDERRRSEARVAALSAEIHDAAPAASAAGRAALSDPPQSRIQKNPPYTHFSADPAYADLRADVAYTDLSLNRVPEDAPSFTNLFAAQPAASASRPFAVLAGGTLVFGAAVAMAILFGGGFSRAPRTANPVPVAAAASLPLELVALGHERVGDQLTVRGVVRNPASGAAMDRLTAVVFVFTSEGGYLASGRAAVEPPVLRPGGESTFVVTVPGAGDVGRYRVSFRTDDRVVPHLDRRHEQD